MDYNGFQIRRLPSVDDEAVRIPCVRGRSKERIVMSQYVILLILSVV